MTTMRRLGVVLTLLLAVPAWTLATELDDEGAGPEPGLPEPAAVEPHVAAPSDDAPAPPPPPSPAAAAPATPHPPPPAAGATVPPATDAPKRLGRPFPTPITPRPPPEDPEVHVTIIPSGDSSVTRNRLRGGGDRDDAPADQEHEAAEHQGE